MVPEACGHSMLHEVQRIQYKGILSLKKTPKKKTTKKRKNKSHAESQTTVGYYLVRTDAFSSLPLRQRARKARGNGLEFEISGVLRLELLVYGLMENQ